MGLQLERSVYFVSFTRYTYRTGGLKHLYNTPECTVLIIHTWLLLAQRSNRNVACLFYGRQNQIYSK